MLQFLIRRLTGAVVIMFLIGAFTFFLFYTVPQDFAALSCGKNCSPENLAVIRENLGLDKPITTQFWEFMSGIVAAATSRRGTAPRRAWVSPSKAASSSGTPSSTASR